MPKKQKQKKEKRYSRHIEEWIYTILNEWGLLSAREDEIVELLEKKLSEEGLLEKIQEGNEDYFNTPTKKEFKEAKKERPTCNGEKNTTKERSLRGLTSLINSHFNRLNNGHYTFNISNDMLYVMDLNPNHNLEHRFLRIETESMLAENSLYTCFKDVFDFEDAWQTDVNFKKKVFKTKEYKAFMDPSWVHRDDSYVPEMYLADGGFVNRGTYKKFDTVPAMLCRNEVVWTQEAVRGAGRGSYRRGAQLLFIISKYFETLAKQYPYER